MALTTIATFRDAPTAHIARARLEACGIPAFVADEHLVGVHWLYSDAIGGVRVQVPAAYAEEALVAVQADRSGELRALAGRRRGRLGAEACPECGGGEIDRESVSREVGAKRRTWTLWTQARRCTSCGKRWS